MSLTITIKVASCLSDIKIKSHLNTEKIEGNTARYASRAGEENENELLQAWQNAMRSLKGIVRRFLVKSAQDTAGNDQFSNSTADVTMTLDLTERRSYNIGEPLSQAFHNYLVGSTLRRFYTSVMEPDMAKLYAADETLARQEIDDLLYRKSEPTYTVS